MEWLKTILEKAVITDGKLDIEGIMKAASAEFPRHAVPKQEFNDRVTELKKANDTIADLKKTNGSNEELQKKVEDYETEIKNLKASAENIRKEYVLKEKLKEAGAADTDYIIYKQGGIDKFAFDKEGNPIGVDDIIKPLKEISPHLFAEEFGVDYKPAAGSNPLPNNPFAKDSFNLTEQGRLLKTNPEQAKQLASAAGVTINV